MKNSAVNNLEVWNLPQVWNLRQVWNSNQVWNSSWVWNLRQVWNFSRITSLQRSVIPLMAAILLTGTVYAGGDNNKELKIKTSAQCEMCKERIEEAMAFERGIKKADLNLDDKILTVSYREGRTNPEKIRKSVSKVGYDADEVSADPKAYNKLPGCCRKPDDPEHNPMDERKGHTHRHTEGDGHNHGGNS